MIVPSLAVTVFKRRTQFFPRMHPGLSSSVKPLQTCTRERTRLSEKRAPAYDMCNLTRVHEGRNNCTLLAKQPNAHTYLVYIMHDTVAGAGEKSLLCDPEYELYD